MIIDRYNISDEAQKVIKLLNGWNTVESKKLHRKQRIYSFLGSFLISSFSSSVNWTVDKENYINSQ